LTSSPFLAYDIRGKIGEQLTEEMAHDVGLDFAKVFGPKTMVVGRDVRRSSPVIAEKVSDGLNDAGVDVFDIGLCGTEVVYFATPHLDADGGIMVTASHNPMGYNGMKLVKKNSVPVSKDNGLHTIRDMVEKGGLNRSSSNGSRKEIDVWKQYTEKVLSFMKDRRSLEGMRIVTDPGHGCAGPALDLISEDLGMDLVKMHHEPDGSFPAGIPNPILPEMRGPVSDMVSKSDADAGIAWDGDFDRCFLFDERGHFTEGYYIVGLLARKMLQLQPGGKIIHDPRLVWNTIEMVKESGGIPLMNRTGHAFIKDRMRAEDAIYGGEMSAHHYFRDFYYCDTGMVPWIMVLELMAEEKKRLSELIGERRERFPVSGEINRKVSDQNLVISSVEEHFGKGAVSLDYTDGVSIEHEKWRMNLRASNTEPLIRLNIETRGDIHLLKERTDTILDHMDKI
jgi:phosphomannomutase